jgi:hypothetical protein
MLQRPHTKLGCSCHICRAMEGTFKGRGAHLSRRRVELRRKDVDRNTPNKIEWIGVSQKEVICGVADRLQLAEGAPCWKIKNLLLAKTTGPMNGRECKCKHIRNRV